MLNTSDDPKHIRLLTVDDHLLLREGLAAIVENQPDMEIVGEASNGLEAIESFRRLQPDVTLMDLRMPGMSGIETIAAIRATSPKARIIVLTTYAGDVQAVEALKAGASGYLLKNMLRQELLESIRAVHAGRRYVPAAIATDIAEHAADGSLTAREVEVLRLVAAGSSNKLIAARLAISQSTVKAHMKSILPKLGATDRTHAVTIALKRGIIDL